MVPTDWVLFRIINTQDLDTVREYHRARGKIAAPNPKISNRDLVSEGELKGFIVVQSGQENFHIKTFCIMPKTKCSPNEKPFIKALVNQLEMLFLIFTSVYYKDSCTDNGNPLTGRMHKQG